MIQITPQMAIDESEIEEKFVRTSGPGGQHVNKVSTAVQLRFNVRQSSLPEEVRQRLVYLAGRRMSNDGVLIIEASRHRSQKKNREDALKRLVELIRKAAARPKKRRKARPSRAAKEERLHKKRQRSEIKKLRKSVKTDQ